MLHPVLLNGRSPAGFKAAFGNLIEPALLKRVLLAHGPAKRRPPEVSLRELIMGLVFHCLQGAGTLAANLKACTGKKVSDSALSQRRQNLAWEIFSTIMQAALSPIAQKKKHPQAFYRGLRLVGMDGSQFSLSNTPAILTNLRKAASRRMQAAFAKMGVCLLVELGMHNPIGAAIARAGESELALARGLIKLVPEGSLLIADRLYGVGAFVALLAEELVSTKSHFLLRARSNLKAKVLRVLWDGSALVEVRVKGHGKLLLREICGRVRRPRGKWVDVRFWSDLLDAKEYPASEMIGLYARRWEQELSYKELKVDMRGAELLNSHTPETAAQEIAALILAHAILARERVKTAQAGGIEVMRISFGRTLVFVRALWLLLAASEGLLTGRQSAAMTRKAMHLIAEQALPKRRNRSCPRAVRQPIGSWPRLTKNTYQNGPTKYQITRIATDIS